MVDRFKVRADLQLRLAESFETALELSDGLAMVAFMDEKARRAGIFLTIRLLRSAATASANWSRACSRSTIRPARARLATDSASNSFSTKPASSAQPDASLSTGAIRGWDKRSIYYYHMLNSLAEHYGFDIDTPFNKLPKKYQKIVLHGSGDDEICFSYINDRGDVYQRTHRFEGVIPNFERRYRETESQSVRDELAKHLSTQKCPDCERHSSARRGPPRLHQRAQSTLHHDAARGRSARLF